MPTVNQYLFGNSLVNYASGGSYSNVPVWLDIFAENEGNSYAVNGGYGFLREFADRLEPVSQWGFQGVATAWDDQSVSFGDAQFDSILITPANFIQDLTPDTDYFGDTRSPLDAVLDVVGEMTTLQPEARIMIYQGWADLSAFSAFPPSAQALADYHAYNMGAYSDWYTTLVDQVNAADPDANVELLPVASILSELFTTVLADIPAEELYVDDAPHGTDTTYFLASMIVYQASYGTEPVLPTNLPVPIHPTVLANFDAINDVIGVELVEAGILGDGPVEEPPVEEPPVEEPPVEEPPVEEPPVEEPPVEEPPVEEPPVEEPTVEEPPVEEPPVEEPPVEEPPVEEPPVEEPPVEEPPVEEPPVEEPPVEEPPVEEPPVEEPPVEEPPVEEPPVEEPPVEEPVVEDQPSTESKDIVVDLSPPSSGSLDQDPSDAVPSFQFSDVLEGETTVLKSGRDPLDEAAHNSTAQKYFHVDEENSLRFVVTDGREAVVKINGETVLDTSEEAPEADPWIDVALEEGSYDLEVVFEDDGSGEVPEVEVFEKGTVEDTALPMLRLGSLEQAAMEQIMEEELCAGDEDCLDIL